MAKIFLETSDSARTANDNNDSFYGLAGDQVVTVKAKGISVDAAVERLVFSGQMSDYTFVQSGPNALKVMKGADTITTAFVQADANGTQLTFANGTVNAVLGAGTITLGGKTLGTTAGPVIPAAADIDTTVTTPGEVTPPPVSTTSDLTVDQDNLLGTGGDNTFTGYIFDNQNTLQNGDMIDGGAGTDSLHAEVGNSQDFAIQPRLTSVENIFIQAQATDIRDYADNFNSLPLYSPLSDQGAPFSYLDASHDGFTQIDAGKIVGVRQLWSDDSRANLVIEDVSVNSHETTIGMRDTDPGNVNYEVYFDPQNITGPGADSTGGSLTISLADVLNLADFGAPLNMIPYDGLILKIGTTSVELDINFAALDDYADFKAAIDAQLAAKGVTGITVTVLPDRPIYFSDNVGTHVPTEYAGDYNQILLTNAGGEVLDLVSYTQPVGAPPADKNIFSTTSTDTPDTMDSLTQVDIILDNVARGDISGSGDLVIGDMSESGIQQFNVQVDRSSHLDQLASTNNVLEVINVENIGADGDLIINRIDDVRVFDASAMVGEVSLGAYLSENITEKYLDLQDTDTNPALDNSELQYANVADNIFLYDLGTADDTLDLAISANNWTDDGTTTREDFVLEVNGNDGNDDITLAIVNGFSNDSDNRAYGKFQNGNDYPWYNNSNLNANLSINGGAGNDTIKTPGSGNVIIDAGSGNDTVYADNTGDKAVFAFNLNGTAPAVLISDANNTYKIFDGKLTVTYLGFNVTVALPNTNGVVSDLQVNQAIKAAINGTPEVPGVLSKLLVANDGPANTLVVTSLIDGEMNESDLTISIAAPALADLSPSDVILLNGTTYYNTPTGTAASHLATIQAAVLAFNTKADYETSFAFGDSGSDSDHTSDNIITGGLGNDVIVLGTGMYSNDTVVYEGYNNSTIADTIVNFDDTAITFSDVVTTITPGSTNTPETFTATFSALTVGATPGDTTIEFDDSGLIAFSDAATNNLIPAADVAYQFALGYVGTNWIVDYIEGTNQVAFTAATPGNVDMNLVTAGDQDVVAADFVILPATSTATVTISSYVDGTSAFVAAESAYFDIDFNGSITISSGTFTFDYIDEAATPVTHTINIAYVAGDGPITLSAKFAAALNAEGFFTATDNQDGTVSVVATTPGLYDLDANVWTPNAADIAAAALIGIDIAVSTYMDEDGADQVGIAPVTAISYDQDLSGTDFLDFSSYEVDRVYVGAVMIVDLATSVNDHYVQLVESTTNPGSYTIYEYDAVNGFGGTGVDADILLGTIGVADFGATQAFTADTFII